jgi:hypothetical protein
MKEKYGGLNLICKLVIIKEIIACMYKNCKKKKKFRYNKIIYESNKINVYYVGY